MEQWRTSRAGNETVLREYSTGNATNGYAVERDRCELVEAALLARCLRDVPTATHTEKTSAIVGDVPAVRARVKMVHTELTKLDMIAYWRRREDHDR